MLRIYENTAPTNADVGVALYQVLSGWTSTNVSYNQSVGLGQTGFYDPANLDLYTDIDVTSIVAGWLADPATNFGFSLRSESEGLARTAKYFEGFYGVTVPQLIVTYAVPEPASIVLLVSAAIAAAALVFLRSNERLQVAKIKG